MNNSVQEQKIVRKLLLPKYVAYTSNNPTTVVSCCLSQEYDKDRIIFKGQQNSAD